MLNRQKKILFIVIILTLVFGLFFALHYKYGSYSIPPSSIEGTIYSINSPQQISLKVSYSNDEKIASENEIITVFCDDTTNLKIGNKITINGVESVPYAKHIEIQNDKE